MISLTLVPVPTLTIDDNTYHGINILEKLSEIRYESTVAEQLFTQIATTYLRHEVPRLGFRLHSNDAVIPSKNIIDVGYDVTIISVAKQLTHLTTMFETNVSLDIPIGYYVELVARSSLSKTGYMLANAVGIIDPAYTGTIKVPLIKVDPSAPDLILPARVAQLILKQYVVSDSYEANPMAILETSRGSGGFGSTNR